MLVRFRLLPMLFKLLLPLLMPPLLLCCKPLAEFALRLRAVADSAPRPQLQRRAASWRVGTLTRLQPLLWRARPAHP
eukprot:913850-Pleurochrysis_carterae.AAC.3